MKVSELQKEQEEIKHVLSKTYCNSEFLFNVTSKNYVTDKGREFLNLICGKPSLKSSSKMKKGS